MARNSSGATISPFCASGMQMDAASSRSTPQNRESPMADMGPIREVFTAVMALTSKLGSSDASRSMAVTSPRQKVETVWVMLKKVEWRIRASRCFSGVLQYRSSAGASVKIMPTACILTCPPTRPAIWKKERQ